VHDNIAKYRGNPNQLVIWAHSAGNGPLGMYVGHPERWKNGVQVKGAIFMSGNPVPGVGGAPGPSFCVAPLDVAPLGVALAAAVARALFSACRFLPNF